MAHSTYATLGEWLKTRRLRAKLRQEDIAAVLCVTRSQISRIESSTRPVDVIEFMKMTRVYNVSIEEAWEVMSSLTSEQSQQLPSFT